MQLVANLLDAFMSSRSMNWNRWFVRKSLTWYPLREGVDPTFIERVQATDWSNLKDAYGYAFDVPFILIACAQRRTSPWPCELLNQHLCHQDEAVFEATLTALPFLRELVTVQEKEFQLEVIHILQSIAFCVNPDHVETTRSRIESEIFKYFTDLLPELVEQVRLNGK